MNSLYNSVFSGAEVSKASSQEAEMDMEWERPGDKSGSRRTVSCFSPLPISLMVMSSRINLHLSHKDVHTAVPGFRRGKEEVW